MRKEKKVCRDCGKGLLEDFIEIDGEYLCEDCYEENYFTCEDCGEIFHRDDGYWVDSEEKLVCEDCLNNNYFCCEHCNNYFSYDSNYYTIHNNYSEYLVCEHCYSYGDYCYCDNCGEHWESDYCHWRNDYCYCDSCYEDNGLYEYHDFSDWEFFKGSNEDTPRYYIGKEIELEPKHYCNLSSVLNAMENNINAVGMEDGSLCGDSVEVVTHPESWEYLQEHKQNYIDFFSEVERLEYGDNGGAGLHFHISRPNDNVIARLIIMLESFKEEIKLLSRRNGNFGWSHFITDSNRDDNIKYQSSKYLKEKYIKEYHDRYMALNLTNTNTIEFRFFNGANNFEEFWGAMQFIHNLMEIALDEDKDINQVQWKDLIYGDELIKQAKKLGVYEVEKNARDTTDIVEKIEKITEETKEKIKKTLKNLIRFINKEIADYKLEDLKTPKIEDIESNTSTMVEELIKNTRYLTSVIDFYKALNGYSINGIKNNLFIIDKDKKYNRYFKQINKVINNYESEVAM